MYLLEVLRYVNQVNGWFSWINHIINNKSYNIYNNIN